MSILTKDSGGRETSHQSKFVTILVENQLFKNFISRKKGCSMRSHKERKKSPKSTVTIKGSLGFLKAAAQSATEPNIISHQNKANKQGTTLSRL